MFRKITSDNKVFMNEEFQKDKYEFNIIMKNLSSDDLELYSDEENYIICRGSKNLPTWIWTRDNISEKLVVEIEELIKLYLTDKEKDAFTCKREFYNMLIQSGFKNINKEDYFEMGFLRCDKLIGTRKHLGRLSKPTEKDRAILEKFWYDDSIESNGIANRTIEQAKKDVDAFLKRWDFFVLRNDEGKVVSMASFSVLGDQGKFGNVYTPPEERRKGYASYLVYILTMNLLCNDLVPIVYTEYNYGPSNKMYKSIGYEDKGVLVNFSCSKVKEKAKQYTMC